MSIRRALAGTGRATARTNPIFDFVGDGDLDELGAQIEEMMHGAPRALVIATESNDNPGDT